MQPPPLRQLSLVQGFLSSHCKSEPAHAPPAHTSALVQVSPSSHAALLLAWTQPVATSQLSLVHGLASSQLLNGPVHILPLQASWLVHGLPSSHPPA
jgi:hypothetical protein